MVADSLPVDWRQVTQRFGLIGWHLAATAGQAALAAVQAAGLRTACYTVNEIDAARRLFAQGVTAIFSDRPDRWSPGEM
jgi:glycerophosphoryl diester phosphodiesterase